MFSIMFIISMDHILFIFFSKFGCNKYECNKSGYNKTYGKKLIYRK